MTLKKNIPISLLLFIAWIFLIPSISSCGKSGSTSPNSLNIQYEILNLSPDLFPVNLYIAYAPITTGPFSFPTNLGYFYVPSLDTPYQIRTSLISNATIFTERDTLKTGLKYSLFITGTQSDNSLFHIFTVDTATEPTVGHGKIRLVNVSPTATGGLDVFANGTPALSKIVYKTKSKYIELPAGNYDIQTKATGSANVLNDQPAVTIEDGRLYTLYAYGYTTRSDSAAFNVGIITNK
jgi:hypothetical protein